MPDGAFPQKMWFLRQVNIFRGIPDADYSIIDRHSSERRFRRGETIYRIGSDASSIFMLKRGKVKLSRLTDDGKEIIFAILKEGDVFGELALSGERSRDEEAIALTDTYLCVMRREDFESLLRDKPYLSLRFIKWVGLRRRTLEHRLEDLLFRSVPSRLSRLLNSLAKDFGEPMASGAILIPFPLSHKEIANLTGTSRETVSALLSDWKKTHIIDYSRRNIVILDPTALQSIASSP
jgi:CRP/FNR family cyclic AMP-dependent transcriptional regulator